MEGFVVAAVGCALAGILVGLLYVWATFVYETNDDVLVLRWRVLGRIPFRTREVKLSEIVDVRLPGDALEWFATGDIFGNPFSRNAVDLHLRHRLGFLRRLRLSPRNPEEFVARLKAALEKRQDER